MTTSLAFPILDEDLSARLQLRLADVEKALTGHVRSRAGFVTEAASHLMEAGGKRFRPLLVLLAAETGEHPDVEDVITAACVVELTHLASLYHDDVMDEAMLRRGSASANARFDNHVAILTGDFLFSKSSELTAELGAAAVRIQAQTFTRLVEGQILETLKPGPDEDALAHYLDVVAGKTGSLIATSARYGAMFGGAPPDVEEALTSYGNIVGTAFQLSDDILDVASESGISGTARCCAPPRRRCCRWRSATSCSDRRGRRPRLAARRLGVPDRGLRPLARPRIGLAARRGEHRGTSCDASSRRRSCRPPAACCRSSTPLIASRRGSPSGTR